VAAALTDPVSVSGVHALSLRHSSCWMLPPRCSRISRARLSVTSTTTPPWAAAEGATRKSSHRNWAICTRRLRAAQQRVEFLRRAHRDRLAVSCEWIPQVDAARERLDYHGKGDFEWPPGTRRRGLSAAFAAAAT
jgi:hypothetical protein